MRLIILEGVDGGGKTTLAKELEKLGYEYVHHGVPPADEEDLFKWFFEPLWEAHQRGSQVVFDRLHLSDRIYGPVMRGGSPMSHLQERLIDRFINGVGGQVVLCLPPWRYVLKSWLQRPEEEYLKNVDQLQEVYQGYLDLLMEPNNYYTWFDYTHERVESVARSLAILQNHALPPGYVGNPNARFLFVGEKCNGERDTPFLDWRNSSGYLHECISEAGYVEDELAFTNSRLVSGKPTPFEVGSWTVIALGAVAHRELFTYGIEHHSLEHPQHWKRFHAGERNDYVERLRKIRREAS